MTRQLWEENLFTGQGWAYIKLPGIHMPDSDLAKTSKQLLLCKSEMGCLRSCGEYSWLFAIVLHGNNVACHAPTNQVVVTCVSRNLHYLVSTRLLFKSLQVCNPQEIRMNDSLKVLLKNWQSLQNGRIDLWPNTFGGSPFNYFGELGQLKSRIIVHDDRMWWCRNC